MQKKWKFPNRRKEFCRYFEDMALYGCYVLGIFLLGNVFIGFQKHRTQKQENYEMYLLSQVDEQP
jgi:capsule polysaccharide modification protein KpsS